jgi:hypothetical protein
MITHSQLNVALDLVDSNIFFFPFLSCTLFINNLVDNNSTTDLAPRQNEIRARAHLIFPTSN